jgi:glycosyltransferase involved in cell wall biosynthesis
MSQRNPIISVVVPAFNVAATIHETLVSISNQTFTDIEIIVVNDDATDNTPTILENYDDPRLRVIHQANRGLAGARNTGIYHAKGKYIAFCDADDVWEAEKLERHFNHLEGDDNVGISFAGSSLIDKNGDRLKISQTPKLKNIRASDVFRRNPIGNGSAAVIRREAFNCISYRPSHEVDRDWWFDETMRQSEDIDAWMRFILASDWKIEGIEGLLTRYRIQSGGLSANLSKQYETWKHMCSKVIDTAPNFAAYHAPIAEAYQLRFLARRAFMMGDGATAMRLVFKSLAKSRVPLWEEPIKTVVTVVAAVAQGIFGGLIKPSAQLKSVNVQ